MSKRSANPYVTLTLSETKGKGIQDSFVALLPQNDASLCYCEARQFRSNLGIPYNPPSLFPLPPMGRDYTKLCGRL